MTGSSVRAEEHAAGLVAATATPARMLGLADRGAWLPACAPTSWSSTAP